jgi:hypothetical protein
MIESAQTATHRIPSTKPNLCSNLFADSLHFLISDIANLLFIESDNLQMNLFQHQFAEPFNVLLREAA